MSENIGSSNQDVDEPRDRETKEKEKKRPSINNFKASLQSTFGPTFAGFESRYKEGLLHMNILFIVAIYNFIFFQSSEGKDLYVILPLLLGGIAFVTQYWVVKTKTRAYVGTILVLFGLFWDLFVSITYIWNPNGGYDFDTVPTIILDTLGIIIGAFWLDNREKFKIEIEQKEEEMKKKIQRLNQDI